MRIDVPLLTPPEGLTHLRVEVDYEKGGGNVWSGRQDPRGIWAHATPIGKEDGVTRFRLMAGLRRFLVPMPRLNRKKLLEYEQLYEAEVRARTGPVWELALKVCEKEKVQVPAFYGWERGGLAVSYCFEAAGPFLVVGPERVVEPEALELAWNVSLGLAPFGVLMDWLEEHDPVAAH